jgi:hypothetical protein
MTFPPLSAEFAAHSGLRLANFTTLIHFSVSPAMNFAKSAGEFGGMTRPPRSSNRDLIVGSAIASLIDLLSKSMIAVGVFLGAPKPFQPNAS